MTNINVLCLSATLHLYSPTASLFSLPPTIYNSPYRKTRKLDTVRTQNDTTVLKDSFLLGHGVLSDGSYRIRRSPPKR